MDVHDPAVMQRFKVKVHKLLAGKGRECNNIQLDVAIHAALDQYGMRNLNQEKITLRGRVHDTYVDEERFTQMVLAHVLRSSMDYGVVANPRVNESGPLRPVHYEPRVLTANARNESSIQFELRPVFR